MSMRTEFDKILAGFGHKVLLQRIVQSVTPGADRVYTNALERHLTRHVGLSSSALTGLGKEEVEGLLNTSVRVYYFKWYVNPFEGDRIYEWDKRAPGNQTVWEIDQAVPLRGDEGIIVFWTVGVTRIHPN